MPLWQSMQVFSPVSRKVSCASAARALCRLMSMDSDEWQLRHSSELFALRRDHSRVAMASLCASNSSGVSMTPKIVPQSSLVA